MKLDGFLIFGHDEVDIFQDIFELGIIQEGQAVIDDFFVEVPRCGQIGKETRGAVDFFD